MTRSSYYDRNGRPLELHEWKRLHGDRDYLAVALHWVRGWMIATVWLGLDFSFGYGGAPLIFETMVFPPGDVSLERASWLNYQERCSTEEEARACHDRAIAWLAVKLGDDALADLAGPLVPGSSDTEWDGSL